MLRRRPPAAPTLQEQIDALDDRVMAYGRAVETVVAARAAGCFVASPQPDGIDIARAAERLDRRAAASPADRDRTRALLKVAGHLRELDRAVAAPAAEADLGHGGLEVLAAALAAALDVFARPDVHGLVRLQLRVDLLLDHVERSPRLRSLAVHLLGVGTAAEFAWANHPHLYRAGAAV